MVHGWSSDVGSGDSAELADAMETLANGDNAIESIGTEVAGK